MVLSQKMASRKPVRLDFPTKQLLPGVGHANHDVLMRQVFLQHLQNKNNAYSSHTVRAYVQVMEKLLGYLKENNLTLDCFHVQHAEGFLAKLGTHPASYNLRLAGIRMLFDAFIQQGWVESNPFSGLKGKPKTVLSGDKAKCYGLGEAQRLLDVAVLPQDEVLVRLVLFVGLGTGELMRLQWHHWQPLQRRLLVIGRSGVLREMEVSADDFSALRTWQATCTSPYFFPVSDETLRNKFRSLCAKAHVRYRGLGPAVRIAL